MQYLKSASSLKMYLEMVRMHKIDTAFAMFSFMLAVSYYFYVSEMVVPRWDGAAYLENAQNWIKGEPLFEPFRPQLMSWMMAIVWTVSGENWEPMKYLQAGFTIA